MASFNPFIASLNFTRAPTFLEGAGSFIAGRSLVFNVLKNYLESFTAWISQPAVFAIIIAWAITFTIIVAIILSLGFGPAGVVGSSAAAAFQAWMYGGFTPAAGIFATLTSLGMLGLLMPPVALFAAFVATVVAGIIWACGVGT